MSNIVEGEPRSSQEWHGSYLDENGMDAIDRKLTAKINALFEGGISEMVEARVAKALKVAKA
jgi:hypothetical protein